MPFWLWPLTCAQTRNCFESRWRSGKLGCWWAAPWEQVGVMDEGEWKRNIRHFCCCRKPSSSVSSCQYSVLQGKQRKTWWTNQGNSMLWHHSHVSLWKPFLPQVSASLHRANTAGHSFRWFNFPPSLLLMVSREVGCVSPALFFPSCLAHLVPSRLSGVRGALNACKEPACRAICTLLLSSSWPEETEFWLGTADVLHRAEA